jgi:hypothetical protein
VGHGSWSLVHSTHNQHRDQIKVRNHVVIHGDLCRSLIHGIKGSAWWTPARSMLAVGGNTVQKEVQTRTTIPQNCLEYTAYIARSPFSPSYS